MLSPPAVICEKSDIIPILGIDRLFKLRYKDRVLTVLKKKHLNDGFGVQFVYNDVNITL